MKKFFALLMTLALSAFPLSAPASAEDTELIVFAAASLTEALTGLGEIYMEENPGVTLLFNFDSSGTLKTQIEEGADCDIFLSAGQKQMNQLDDMHLLLNGSRFDMLENKVALAVPEDNPANILSYADLAEALRSGDILLAMGNADVPVGQYTQKILAYFALNEADLAGRGCLTYGSNVKEVTSQVSEGIVDCGIIYQTDAFSAALTVVDTASEEMCGQVIYPAAVLNSSARPEAAQAFLEFLTGEAADAVFAGIGFTPIEPVE